jgi:transposase-like protein
MGNKKSRYTPAPEVPPEVAPTYAAVLSVLSGQTTVAEAARGLDTARNHFQTMMHRALAGMIDGLRHRPTGRAPSMTERERELSRENERLRRDNERLEQRVATTSPPRRCFAPGTGSIRDEPWAGGPPRRCGTIVPP